MKMNQEQIRLLGRIRALEQLSISGQEVPDDNCWASLARLKTLQNLQVEECPLGDTALSELAESSSIEFLLLKSTKVTDQGLIQLQQMKSLKELSLSGRKLSREGVDQFNEARPDVKLSP